MTSPSSGIPYTQITSVMQYNIIFLRLIMHYVTMQQESLAVAGEICICPWFCPMTNGRHYFLSLRITFI